MTIHFEISMCYHMTLSDKLARVWLPVSNSHVGRVFSDVGDCSSVIGRKPANMVEKVINLGHPH